MKKRRLLMVIALALSGCGDAQVGTDTKSSVDPSVLDGVWRVTEVTTPGPDSVTLNRRSPQPGYLLVTRGFYSFTVVTAPQPRPALLPGDSSTVENLRSVWGPFTANAGTIEVTDGRVRFSALVAKNPAVMAPGNENRSEFRILGDSLWLTRVQPDTATVPNPNPVTIKYVRAR